MRKKLINLAVSFKKILIRRIINNITIKEYFGKKFDSLPV
jgi:hypothetical protein